MAVYEIQGGEYEIPDEIQGEQLNQVLSGIVAQLQGQTPQEQPSGLESGHGENSRFFGMANVLEPLATVASGFISEPAAGLAGLASLPFGADTAAENVAKVRESLTYTPRTEQGAKGLQSLGETLSPITNLLKRAETATGEAGYDVAGPIGGAIGETVPTAILSFLPVKSAITGPKNLLKSKALVKEAVPTVDALKTAARQVYNQIDDLGAVVKPASLQGLAKKVATTLQKEGAFANPKAIAIEKEIGRIANNKTGTNVTYIDSIRKAAGDLAGSVEASDRRLGALIIDHVDDYLDSLRTKDFIKPNKADVGALYHDARQLWSRAKKGEILNDAIKGAANQASGFENGLRIRFRQILNSKKKSRGFNQSEINAMETVSKGTTLANTAKLLGRFGFSEKQATNIIGGSIAVGSGYAAAGAPGAVALATIGQVMRGIASKLTKGKADFAKKLALQGKNGEKIISLYKQSVPKNQWNSLELGQLLLENKVDVNKFKAMANKYPKPTRKLYHDAAYMAEYIQTIRSEQE